MTSPSIYADDFGIGTGLEVAIAHTDQGLVLQARLNGKAFESYAPLDTETALEAAGYLIRGSQPPRALFACRGTPVG